MISSISFLPFSGRWHKMILIHKGWSVVKSQHNQSMYPNKNVFGYNGWFAKTNKDPIKVLYRGSVFPIQKYSWTSIAQTLMTLSPWLIRTHFWVPTKMLYRGSVFPIQKYSRTSIAQTLMACSPWLIRTHFWVPTKMLYRGSVFPIQN